MLSNASEAHIFKDRHFLINIRIGPGIVIDGVDEKSQGILVLGLCVFGKAYYPNRVVGNILSYAKCVDELYYVR